MKKIITIGFDIPGYSEESYKSYSANQSLLDADIIVFEPDFSEYSCHESYQGKDCYSENESFRLKEHTKHWHTEISTALQDGKTVFVFLGKYQEVFVHTGTKQYSGTGRNTRITNLVAPYNNYEFLPIEIPDLIPKEGSEVKFLNHPTFSSFWSEFKNYLRYESYLDKDIEKPLFTTKTGNKPIGGIFKLGKGSLVLLPPLRYPDKKFTRYEKGKAVWTEEAIQFGKRLVQILIDIDIEIRDALETTPPPEWTYKSEYSLKKEMILKKKIETVSQELEKYVVEKNVLVNELVNEGVLRNLLFEKGKPLEKAILSALHILGYNAENYQDDDLEIDQIILSSEGERFIGEAEGRDDAAIGIDKFRQLETNIQEDLQREEINTPAIGVLFGNGFRLLEVEKRQEQFTEKCTKNAERLKVVLIRTVDLFLIAKYIKESDDKDFAKECRQAVMENRGKIVEFPKIPAS